MMLAHVSDTATDTGLMTGVPGSDTRMFNTDRIINKLSEHEGSESPHAEDDWLNKLHDELWFLEDMNGYTPLDNKSVVAARRLEIECSMSTRRWTEAKWQR